MSPRLTWAAAWQEPVSKQKNRPQGCLMRAIQRGLLGVSQVTTDGLSRCQVSETSCMGGDSRPLLSPPSALPCQSLLHTAVDLFLVGAG